jgi:xylulokinase
LSSDALLGIDVGTSSLKVLFIEIESGEIHRDEVKLEVIREGRKVEQRPQDYLAALKVIASRNQGWISRTKAIGLSGQTPSLLGVDEVGRPTTLTLIWQDNRATEEAELLAERFGNPWDLIGTSLPWSPSGSPAKAFWLSKNQPELVAKTRWLLQPKDFLGMHLTGAAISDPWSTKGLCGVRKIAPLTEVLEFIGWSDSVVPELRSGSDSRGFTSTECERNIAIPAGIPVSVGWSDAMSGMLSLGVFHESRSFIITGTSAIVGTSSETTPSDAGSLYVIPRECAPLSVTYGPTQMSGGSISWAASILGISENELVELGAQDQGLDAPIYLPYIAGERAPLWRSDIRGSFTQISIEHSRSSFARATMEGISFAERQVLEISQSLAKSYLNSVVLGGHAGNDPRWSDIRRRTLGKSILRIEDIDATCRGAAILAHAILSGDLQESYRALAPHGEVEQIRSGDITYADLNFPRFLSEQRQLLENGGRK